MALRRQRAVPPLAHASTIRHGNDGCKAALALPVMARSSCPCPCTAIVSKGELFYVGQHLWPQGHDIAVLQLAEDLLSKLSQLAQQSNMPAACVLLLQRPSVHSAPAI